MSPDLASDRRFEPAATSVDDVKGWLRQARRHVRSARVLAEVDDEDLDVEQIIDACHAAVRKALAAHMNAAGVRVASGTDAHHRVTIEYGEIYIAEVPPELWRQVRALRKARNDADYTNPTQYRLTARDASAAVELAEVVVTKVGGSVKSLLATDDRPRR